MSERRVCLAAGLAAALLAAPALAEDGPGPNLVIELGGATTGTIVIDMLPDVAPKHVAQITALAEEGAYDGIVFHRVIDGFMAQTGDVQFGRVGGDTAMAGMGGSNRADIPAEFSDITFDRGVRRGHGAGGRSELGQQPVLHHVRARPVP